MENENDFNEAHKYFKRIFLEKKKADQTIKDFPDINKLIIKTINFLSDKKVKKCAAKI